MELLLRVALVAAGFPVVCIACGWCLLAGVADLDSEERFGAAGVVGAAYVAACTFVAFLTGWSPLLVDGLALVVLLTIVFHVRRGRCLPTGAESSCPWQRVALSCLGYAHLLAVQALLPQYVGGQWLGDWYHHYLGARVFAGLEPVDLQWGGAGTYTVASRTPLFNLAAAGVINAAGSDFCVYQTAAAFLSAGVLPTIYLLLRNRCGQQAARLGLLLAPLNLWLLHISWFTWPKMLATAYILLALHFYLRSLKVRLTEPAAARRLFLYCWVSSLLGYMTHQVAVVYLAVLVVHAVGLAVWERRLRLGWGTATLACMASVVALAPWYGWLLFHFGFGTTLGSTPTTQMDPHFEEVHGWAKVGFILGSVIENVWTSVDPVALVWSYHAGSWTSEEAYVRATDVYFNLLTGALTASLCLYLLARTVWCVARGSAFNQMKALSRPQWNAVWAFALVGGLGAAALHPLRSANGVAHSAMFPTTVLLVVLAWGALRQAPRPVRVLVGAGMVAEFLAMFWWHIFWLDPVLFDAYNPAIKVDNHLVFLKDCLGPLPVGAVAALQALLVGLLIRGLATRPAEPPETSPHLVATTPVC